MKRSGFIRRFTPLKPGKCKLKRTGRLRPVSKAKAKRDREANKMLRQYRKRFPRCQHCGGKGEHIHEMFNEGRREIARQHRSCILHLCPECHMALQHAPKAKQLAVKLVADPVGFDLLEWNALRPGEEVTMADVDRYMPETH
jgi:hypothetical protein